MPASSRSVMAPQSPNSDTANAGSAARSVTPTSRPPLDNQRDRDGPIELFGNRKGEVNGRWAEVLHVHPQERKGCEADDERGAGEVGDQSQRPYSPRYVRAGGLEPPSGCPTRS